MEKLLHERLREVDVFDDIRLSETYLSVQEKVARELADEIERYYISRPRFEDGEPVQFGDEIEHPDTGESCIVKSIHVFDDGYYCFSHKGAHKSSHYNAGEFVKRPTPKVDADGVEIKVGDTVYHKETGEEYEVLSLDEILNVKCKADDSHNYIGRLVVTHERPVFDANGERICKGDTVWTVHTTNKFTVHGFTDDGAVIVRFGEDSDDLTTYAPHGLTHREPDSLEKLRDDIEHMSKSLGCHTSGEIKKLSDRLTALIERGA